MRQRAVQEIAWENQHVLEKKKKTIFNLFFKFVFCLAKVNDIHFDSQLLNSEMAACGVSFFFFFFEKITNLD